MSSSRGGWQVRVLLPQKRVMRALAQCTALHTHSHTQECLNTTSKNHQRATNSPVKKGRQAKYGSTSL